MKSNNFFLDGLALSMLLRRNEAFTFWGIESCLNVLLKSNDDLDD